MRVVLLVLVTFFVASCGQIGSRAAWPARISSLSGMTAEEEAHVRQAVGDLNSMAKIEALTFAAASDDSYNISLKKSEPTAQHMERAGFATVGFEDCAIDLSSVLFKTTMKEYIRPVVLHELGHCAGLEHSPNEEDVMYRTTNKDGFYTEEAYARFIRDFKAAAGL